MQGSLALRRPVSGAAAAPHAGTPRPRRERVFARGGASMTGEKGGERAGGEMNRLLAAVADGQDRDAFHALFGHFAPRLKAFMQRHGADPGMAEEVVQETMVNVWRKAGQFDAAKASAATWIFTIARNVRIDLLRKAGRPEPDLNDPALVADPAPAAHDVVSRDQEARRLQAVVATLPAEQREVLHLAFFEEKAHGVVARELGIPLGTVKSRIRLAFKRLRTELGENR
jgi:RNA polymerase sigma-70 factor (ECF subfamily)